MPKVLLIGWLNIQDEKFQCEQCGKCFGFESKIKRHRTTTHTKSNVEFKFNCEQCGRLFEDEQKLSSHSLAHTAERTLPCDECQKSFKLKSHLRVRKLTHKEKNIQCNHCPKMFSDGYLLNVHLKTTHTPLNISCSNCKKAFGQKSDLKVHMRRHIGDKAFLLYQM